MSNQLSSSIITSHHTFHLLPNRAGGSERIQYNWHYKACRALGSWLRLSVSQPSHGQSALERLISTYEVQMLSLRMNNTTLEQRNPNWASTSLPRQSGILNAFDYHHPEAPIPRCVKARRGRESHKGYLPRVETGQESGRKEVERKKKPWIFENVGTY